MIGKPVLGQESEHQLDQTFSQLAASTRFSLVDAGGSKGSYGTTVGLGVTEMSLRDQASYADSVLGSAPDDSRSEPLRWLRVSAITGTPWPVDIGLTVSQLQGTTASQLTGTLQFTIFEDLGWPAISLRLSHSKVLGLRFDSAIQSNTGEIVVTQGLWRYFSGYFALGIDQADINVKIRNSETLHLNEAGELEEHRQINSYLVKGGLQIAAWPPFVHLFGELMTDTQQNKSVSLKLNCII